MELHLDNLACRRGGRLVFQGLTFRLEPGQAAMLRGPNGVGKSTLLRVLAGLVPSASGDAYLGPVMLGRDRGAFQEHVAYAGHLDAVKPALTVAQNLTLWASIFGGTTERALLALDRFGLSRLQDRPVAHCSAGQRRRLGLARLLVQDRPLWLLDEPTVSLDQDASALIAELVREHCASGGSAMIATHIDLGLEDCALLEMEPSQSSVGEKGTDAFLEGNWS